MVVGSRVFSSVVFVGLGLLMSGRPLAAAEAVTFTKDVAPILYERCVSCHRNGEVAPMALTSFAEVRPWIRAIRLAVVSKSMPPWLADGPHGVYSNDPRLSDAQIDTIVRWVDAGAPEGNPASLPALPPLAAGWQMGAPDLILSPGPFEVAAQPRSVYGDLFIPTNFSEDWYVKVAEVRPGNRAYTHHANVLVKDETGMTHRVASYSPGAGAKSYPPGVAKVIPKGATLNLDMHYNPKGEPRVDPGTSIGLIFATEKVRQVALTAQSGTNEIDIAPESPTTNG
jgi:hypothetical protein